MHRQRDFWGSLVCLLVSVHLFARIGIHAILGSFQLLPVSGGKPATPGLTFRKLS